MNLSTFRNVTSRLYRSFVDNWNLDTTLKVGAFVVSIATVWIGIWQYRDTKAKDYQKVFFDERMRTYTELSAIVAKIAVLPPQSKERSDAVMQYWQLYFGKLLLISDAEVGEALHATSKWIVHCVEEKSPPPEKTLCHDVAGNAHALSVNKAARNSIVHTWNVPLENLDEKDIYFKQTK